MTIVVVEVAETSGPDWAAQLTALATLASAPILGVTAIFLRRAARAAVEQLDDARNTRHAQLIVNLSRHWNEVKRAAQLFSAYPERKLLELVLQLYGGRPTDYPVDDFITLIEPPALIETIGVLEQEGGLALNLVDDLWGSTIVSAGVPGSAP